MEISYDANGIIYSYAYIQTPTNIEITPVQPEVFQFYLVQPYGNTYIFNVYEFYFSNGNRYTRLINGYYVNYMPTQIVLEGLYGTVLDVTSYTYGDTFVYNQRGNTFTKTPIVSYSAPGTNLVFAALSLL